MKTLKDHVILYDAACPMCNLYTNGFIKAGMLDGKGRVPYQQMPDNLAAVIDMERCVNEIALVDKTTGEVQYGIESLFQIIGNSFAFLQSLFRNRAFYKIADTAYKMVSFNRRVIVPAKKDQTSNGLNSPSFHRTYRLAFLLLTWIFTSVILYKYNLRLAAILPPGGLFRESAVCGGQILWQLAVLIRIRKGMAWDYLGTMMTVSFAGAILLGLGLTAGKLAGLSSPFFYLLFFTGVVFLMFLEHIRRTRILGLSWKLTASWVLYRVFILLILLNPFYA